jgi:transcriptional regulator with XRE-family HTH domain
MNIWILKVKNLISEITPEEQEKTDKRMQLAARIDKAIKAKGWKKKDFAAAMKKKPSEISKWLSGTHNFNSDTLFEIERVLNICLINISEKPKQQVLKYEVNVSQKVESPQGKPYCNPYSPSYGLLHKGNFKVYKLSATNQVTN